MMSEYKKRNSISMELQLKCELFNKFHDLIGLISKRIPLGVTYLKNSKQFFTGQYAIAEENEKVM